MGYRSDVRIRLTKEDYERLKKEFDEKIGVHDRYNLFKDLSVYKEEIGNSIWEMDNDGEWHEKLVDSVYFGWDYVKWHNDYEDVSFINDFVFKCSYYAFIRIGESSNGDIERLENGFDGIRHHYTFDDDEGGVV